MIAIDKHFFRDLYANLKTSWCSIRDTRTFWWRQNEATEKIAQGGNELMKQLLVAVSTEKVTLKHRYKKKKKKSLKKST